MLNALGTMALMSAAVRRMEATGDNWKGDFDMIDGIDITSAQACNMTDEQIAERDRPVSRQERRKLEREARKGRAKTKII